MDLPPLRDAARSLSWATKGLLAIALVFFLRAAEPLLVPVVSAVVLTFVLVRPLRVLKRAGVPEFVGAALLVSALLGGSTLVVSALAGPARHWMERVPLGVEQIVVQIERLGLLIEPRTAASIPAARVAPGAPVAANAPAPIRDKLAVEGIALTRTVVVQLMSFGLSALATLILLYFLLASEHWIVSRFVQAMPRVRTRAMVLAAMRRAQREIGHFLTSLLIINVAVGFITALAMWWLGLPNPALWGALAAALNFVPYIGPVVMVSLLLLASLLSFGGGGAILAPPLAFMLIHAVESSLVSPWYIGRRLALSPVGVFVAVMCLGWLWGLAGAVLAVPILVGVRCGCRRVKSLRLLCIFLEGDGPDLPTLATLVRSRQRSPRPKVRRAP